jgi:hypothetical protein
VALLAHECTVVVIRKIKARVRRRTGKGNRKARR